MNFCFATVFDSLSFQYIINEWECPWGETLVLLVVEGSELPKSELRDQNQPHHPQYSLESVTYEEAEESEEFRADLSFFLSFPSCSPFFSPFHGACSSMYRPRPRGSLRTSSTH